jgi:fructose-1,6-bisphosphatase I
MIPTRTLGRFIRERQLRHPGSSGELSDLLEAIGLGVKIISEMVATAGFKGLYGYSGKVNVQGEEVRRLDEEADQVLVEILGSSGHFGLLVSEERDDVIAATANRDGARYVVAFDPLDGSSNIGSNIPVGTIFAIFKKKNPKGPATKEDFLQPGSALIAAGYSVYGAKTSFVYSTREGVHDFTLDPTIGEFLLSSEDMQVPAEGKIFSVNEGNTNVWDKRVIEYLNLLKSEASPIRAAYTARYVGSLVADFDRTLRKGGIFLYPISKKHPNGRLRLLYECAPLAFMMEQGKGMASNGSQRVLDVVPKTVHERSAFIAGSTREVELFLKMTSN